MQADNNYILSSNFTILSNSSVIGIGDFTTQDIVVPGPPPRPPLPRTNITCYFQDGDTGALIGPYTERDALIQARAMSQDKKKSGKVVVGTYVGNRPNDPPINPPVYMVTHVFLRGKLTLIGNTAKYSAINRTPPVGPFRFGA